MALHTFRSKSNVVIKYGSDNQNIKATTQLPTKIYYITLERISDFSDSYPCYSKRLLSLSLKKSGKLAAQISIYHLHIEFGEKCHKLRKYEEAGFLLESK